ncbi:MAG: NADH-quinone oxidoreductase subunit NuoE [Pseudomonadota bacterium]
MLRRLHPDQPESFAFTPANLEWAKGQIAKYPEGREASAVIPLLWRAQEQEGWVSEKAIEVVADLLSMAKIRVLEVATFYFMFQLRPVGSVAHVQVCGTTSCMICGAEDLVSVCKEKIASRAHDLSADGCFSWEEVECLGSCANAPMVQIGKDYYEDLTSESFAALLDALAAGEVPVPGSRKGRFSSEPETGLTSLMQGEAGYAGNASVSLAVGARDTIKRITGDEPPLAQPDFAEGGVAIAERPKSVSKDDLVSAPAVLADDTANAPPRLSAPRNGAADDLKRIKGVGPKLEAMLNKLGFYHFDQIALWSDAEVAWVDAHLEGFKGRIERDGWIEQAKALQSAGPSG